MFESISMSSRGLALAQLLERVDGTNTMSIIEGTPAWKK